VLVEPGPAEHDADHPGCRRPTTRFVLGLLTVLTVFTFICPYSTRCRIERTQRSPGWARWW